jgi:hypothetical protein
MPPSRTRLAVVLAATLVGSGVACSLLLSEQALPCLTDADCSKYLGSHCDLAQRQCVPGAITHANDSGVDADSATRDGGLRPDGAPDAVDESNVGDVAVDSGLDASDASSDADAQSAEASREAGPTEPDWKEVQQFLDDLFDPTESLLRSGAGSTQYWTMNDNGFASRALNYLPAPETSRASAIHDRLAQLLVCGCGEAPQHPAYTNHFADPLVTKGAVIPANPATAVQVMPLDTKGGATCHNPFGPVCPMNVIMHEDHPTGGMNTDPCNQMASTGVYSSASWNAADAGTGYADIIAYEILSFRNQGALSTALDLLWENLSSKWDGLGMNDAAFAVNPSAYATYKLALFKLAGRALGKTLPPEVDVILTSAQATTGGIRDSYDTLGRFSPSDRGGVATTALVVLAFRIPVTEL